MKVFWLAIIALVAGLIYAGYQSKQYVNCNENAKSDLSKLSIRNVSSSVPNPRFCTDEQAIFEKWETCLGESELSKQTYLAPVLKLFQPGAEKELSERWEKHLQTCSE